MANQIEIASYDPKKVNLIVNGTVIQNFADGSLITIARSEDIVSPVVGAKGDVTYNENANESGTITATLSGTSSSLPYLRSLAVKRKEISVLVTDANDASAVSVSEKRCRITRPPDLNRAEQIGSETVTIFVPSLNYR